MAEMTGEETTAHEDYMKAIEILESGGDVDKCIRYMRSSEEKGDSWAIYFMAVEYYTGDLLPKDTEEAKKRFERLMHLGYININLLYHQVWGDGSCRLYRRKAFEYLLYGRTIEEVYEYMREHGVPEYDINAAMILFNNLDANKILDYYGEAASLSADASSIGRRNGIDKFFMNQLLEDYLIGTRHMDPDETLGAYVRLSDMDDDVIEVLRRAEEGDTDAQYEMGMRFRYGDGVFDDEEESLRWLDNAAQNGHVEAMFEMGVSFDIGIGVCADEYLAELWYKRAAEHGHEEAKKIVEEMRKFREGPIS